MVTTFPNLGDVGPVLIAFLMESLGIPFPPPLSARTYERGFRIARDAFCHPLKVVLGDMALAIEKGADTIIMSEVEDYCRYGHYWVLMKSILEREFKREIGFLILHHREPLQSLADVICQLGMHSAGIDGACIIDTAAVRSYLYNEALIMRNRVMAGEKRRGDAYRIYREALNLVCNLRDRAESRALREKITRLFAQVPCVKRRVPLKILLTGDLYEMLEPGNNYHLEFFLGGLQVEVIRNLSSNELVLFTNCFDEPSRCELARVMRHYRLLEESARPYLGAEMSRGDIAFGGYGLFSVGSIGAARAYGCDGVIHLGPMGCHSESVARVAMEVIARDLDMPLLSLSIDDHQARAAFLMRVEAFVDMLKTRRERTMYGCHCRC